MVSWVVSTPFRIALMYALFGVMWVLLTDWVLFWIVEDVRMLAQLQTGKGWVFVALSTGVVYSLAHYGRRDLQRTNARLDAALRQSSILHRVLRHNLRNACNVVLGYVELLEDGRGDERSTPLQRIETQTRDLVDLSEKAGTLREIVHGRDSGPVRVDLVDAVQRPLDALRRTHPDATIDFEGPASLIVETAPDLAIAVAELVENAIEHADHPEPSVHVAVTAADEEVTIEVRDRGPGLPPLERDVMEAPLEEPTLHSQGLGLWIARTVVEIADGELTVRENEPRGTAVRLTVPATPRS